VLCQVYGAVLASTKSDSKCGMALDLESASMFTLTSPKVAARCDRRSVRLLIAKDKGPRTILH
jgi:hypothetical protein